MLNQEPEQNPISDKDKTVAGILGIVVGFFGIHRIIYGVHRNGNPANSSHNFNFRLGWFMGIY